MLFAPHQLAVAADEQVQRRPCGTILDGRKPSNLNDARAAGFAQRTHHPRCIDTGSAAAPSATAAHRFTHFGVRAGSAGWYTGAVMDLRARLTPGIESADDDPHPLLFTTQATMASCSGTYPANNQRTKSGRNAGGGGEIQRSLPPRACSHSRARRDRAQSAATKLSPTTGR